MARAPASRRPDPGAPLEAWAAASSRHGQRRADAARSAEIGDILLIAAALVAATRLCAYVSEDLARDLGKILPLTLLGVVLVGEQLPGLSRVETSLREYEWEDSAVLAYGLTLIALEVTLRVLYRSTRFVMALFTRDSGGGG